MLGTSEIVGAGWRGALNAARQNSSLFIVTFLVMLGIAVFFQPKFPTWHPHHQPQVPQPIDMHLWLVGQVQDMFYSIAAAPSMIAVHRFVLLHERGTALYNARRILYFAAWITTFHLLPVLPGPLMNRTAVISTIFFVLVVGIYYCMPRLIMSFPAIATDARNPFGDSWR